MEKTPDHKLYSHIKHTFRNEKTKQKKNQPIDQVNTKLVAYR